MSRVAPILLMVAGASGVALDMHAVPWLVFHFQGVWLYLTAGIAFFLGLVALMVFRLGIASILNNWLGKLSWR